MQDHDHRLRKNRKGVMELPIKLMVVMILLTVSLPIISNAVENNETDMMTAEAEQEAGRIISSMSSAHYSGIGTSVTVNVDLPAGSEIHIGGSGSDAYSLRIVWNGNVTSTHYFEKPVIKITNETTVTGHCTLMLTSVEGDIPSMEVCVL